MKQFNILAKKRFFYHHGTNTYIFGTQLKNHRCNLLARFGNRRTFSATKNVLRFNLSDDGMFLERKSSEFCRIVSSGVRLTFDVRLLQQRTLTAFFVLQLAVDEASSNQPFHPLLVLSFDAFCFWLCGGGVYYTILRMQQQKKIYARTRFCAKPGYDVI